MKTLLASLMLSIGACAAPAPDPATPNAGAAPCTAAECATIPEPPISPLACGPGHERDIGTSCVRAVGGECRKVLTCGGKAP